MSVEKMDVECEVWSRHPVYGMPTHVEVLGKGFGVEFDGYQATVRFPRADDSEKARWGHCEVSPIAGQKRKDGSTDWHVYAVNSLEVELQIPGKISFARRVLEEPPNQLDCIPAELQGRLNRMTEEGKSVARKLIDWVLQYLRISARDGRLAKPSRGRDTAIQGSVIRQRSTRKRLWVGSTVFNAEMPSVHVRESQIKDALLAAAIEEPPIPYFYWGEGDSLAKEGWCDRAVLDLSIAAESYIRAVVQMGLPGELPTMYSEVLDQVNLRRVLTDWGSLLFGKHWISEGRLKTLHKLFDERNKVAHKGIPSNMNASELRDVSETVRWLISINPDGPDPIDKVRFVIG